MSRAPGVSPQRKQRKESAGEEAEDGPFTPSPQGAQPEADPKRTWAFTVQGRGPEPPQLPPSISESTGKGGAPQELAQF